MVKNTGGNKAKGFARKHTNGGKKDMLRVSEDEGEIYSVVTKMCGNSMFECMGIDRVSRLGHIRGKFSGKGKRDNIVQNGIWVLIGVREWDIKKDEGKKGIETKKAKLPQCDLLEVYNDSDKEKLRNEVAAEWKILVKNDPTKIDNEDDFELHSILAKIGSLYEQGGYGLKRSAIKACEYYNNAAILLTCNIYVYIYV